MRIRFTAALAALLALPVVPAGAASFDCNKAQNPDEMAICASPDLSSLDAAMAVAYRQALKKADDKEQVRTVARNALAARQACQWDGRCISEVMTAALDQYKSVLTGGGLAGDKLNYGSKAGMQVSVVGRSGIGTGSAVIRTMHAYEDVVAYCRDYELNVTPKCIAEEGSVRLSPEIHANCLTGRFDTLGGQRYRYMGRRDDSGEGAEFRIVEDGSSEPLDEGMASGYFTALAQLQALCPQDGR